MNSANTAPDAGVLTEAQAAEFLKCSKVWLRKARCRGTGPAFVRLGRMIRYRLRDLEQYLDARIATNTLGGRNG